MALGYLSAATPYGSVLGYLSAATGTGYTPSVRYTPATSYNVNPTPTSGQGPYGSVPGPIGIPPNYWEQMQSVYPVMPQAQTASGIIGSELAGELSPSTIAALQTHAAQFGSASTGGPSQFSGNQGLVNLGLNVEKRKAQGLQDYESMLKALSGTMTPQDLAAQIAARNATMGAAPDPQQAAEQQMRDWMDKFRMTMAASTPQTRNYSLPPRITSPTDYGQVYSPYSYGPAGGTMYSAGTWAPANYDALGITGLVDDANFEQWLGELGYDPYGYALGTEIPVGSYPQSSMEGNISYTQPEDWWVGGYESPADYDIAQYPGWYEDVGYYGE